MTVPKVSVIIPNFNYGKYISIAIESVLSQTHPNVEVIVVDDGSTDESISILGRYGSKLLVIQQRNQGVSIARNNGVAASSGDYVAFLDADDVWLPEKIEMQLRKFDVDRAVGLVHCAMRHIDPDGNVCGSNNEGLEGNVADEFLKFERGVIVGAGSTAVVPRKIFDEIGGFDPRQSTSADWDFGYRVATKYKIAFVPEYLVHYRIHNSNMHSNIARMEHDMLLGYEKAFASGATANVRLSYGNLHRVLAGSYFRAGMYRDFARNAALSLWNRPSGVGYFLKYPLRKIERKE